MIWRIVWRFLVFSLLFNILLDIMREGRGGEKIPKLDYTAEVFVVLAIIVIIIGYEILKELTVIKLTLQKKESPKNKIGMHDTDQ